MITGIYFELRHMQLSALRKPFFCVHGKQRVLTSKTLLYTCMTYIVYAFRSDFYAVALWLRLKISYLKVFLENVNKRRQIFLSVLTLIEFILNGSYFAAVESLLHDTHSHRSENNFFMRPNYSSLHRNLILVSKFKWCIRKILWHLTGQISTGPAALLQR